MSFSNAAENLPQHNDGSMVEFCGARSIAGFDDYEIVYETNLNGGNSMKRHLIILFLAVLLVLSGCINENSEYADFSETPIVTDEVQELTQEEVIEDFDKVIEGIKNVDSQYGYVMDGCDEADYGYYDVDNDGSDELIIQIVRGKTIFMCRNDEITEVCSSPYAVLLDNGIVWYHRPSVAPMQDYYQVFRLEGLEYQLESTFERYDDDLNGVFDENGNGDKYLYNSKEISKEEWDKLLQPYDACREAELHDTGVIQR